MRKTFPCGIFRRSSAVRIRAADSSCTTTRLVDSQRLLRLREALRDDPEFAISHDAHDSRAHQAPPTPLPRRQRSDVQRPGKRRDDPIMQFTRCHPTAATGDFNRYGYELGITRPRSAGLQQETCTQVTSSSRQNVHHRGDDRHAPETSTKRCAQAWALVLSGAGKHQRNITRTASGSVPPRDRVSAMKSPRRSSGISRAARDPPRRSGCFRHPACECI